MAKVSRAAYYKWVNRQPVARELENEQLVKSIQHLYMQVDGIYGYRNHLAIKLYQRIGYQITGEINKPKLSLYRMVKNVEPCNRRRIKEAEKE